LAIPNAAHDTRVGTKQEIRAQTRRSGKDFGFTQQEANFAIVCRVCDGQIGIKVPTRKPGCVFHSTLVDLIGPAPMAFQAYYLSFFSLSLSYIGTGSTIPEGDRVDGVIGNFSLYYENFHTQESAYCKDK
jgi:hypothetical protein